MNIIKEKMSVTELLAGLAEECSELSHAALKFRRVIDGSNPTPVERNMAISKLYEEIADVQLYLSMIDVPWKRIKEIVSKKQKRWEDRLNERG